MTNAGENNRILTIFSVVDVVITYKGGAIKLMRIGTTSVEQAIPARSASFTASIPSYV